MNCVILCGGTGSRLWPLSREKLPKQLLAIVDDRTMLQNTVLRCNNLPMKNLLIICNKEHSFLIQQQVKELNLDISYKIVAEPMGRDTSAAVATAALFGEKEDITLIVPCDHVFDSNAFSNIVLDGMEYSENSIVTFGIKPTRPETGYGYIEADKISKQTLQFVEKPDYKTACDYLNSDNFYWNAGVFLFKNKIMLQCFKNYASDILENCKDCLSNIDCTFQQNDIVNLPEKFVECRAISVDYAIMENLCKEKEKSWEIQKITLAYDSIWCDIGSFNALHEHLLDDENTNRNILKGDIISNNTTNCYIETENALVATFGINNLVIVNTRDALLVCNKDDSQQVKKIVDLLKVNKRQERIIHAKAFRPWGWYCNVEGNDTSGFKVKRICIYPGMKLSLQSHNNRSEHWVIVKGDARVQVGDDFLNLGVNQHVYIPKKTLHRIENIGNEMLEFVETQIGDYLGEEDIIRYEDDFGRI